MPWQTHQGCLRLQTQAEQRLLLALMQFPGGLTKPIYDTILFSQMGCHTLVPWPLSDHIIQHQVQLWCQLFKDFYSECRILGIQSESRELAQTRLGFILLLKNVLEFWLQSVLNIEAPLAL
jgi:DALR anticodon binding domain